jgi:hypothetical protein
MSTSEELAALVYSALTTADDTTDAGANVYKPGDWPTQADQYPRLKLRVTRESKQSLGRGGPPEFTVITTLRIIGEVSEPADVNDAGATAAEAALWRLSRQVEIAVIGSYPLTAELQQFATVDSQLAYNSDAETHLAGIQIDIGLEHYQGPEMFAPVIADDVTDVEVTLSTYPPHSLSVDPSA